VPVKRYSEQELEDFLRGVDETNPDNLFIDGSKFNGKVPLSESFYMGKFDYNPTRWRALMARASNVVVWGYERSDGEIMFVDYYDPPGSRWRLYNKWKWNRR
jgi:hypothetical protein